jgi:hypothetical protein
MPLHDFIARLNRMLDEVAEFAHSRSDALRAPADRARAMAEGVVQAATQQLHEAMPGLTEDLRSLAPVGAEIASQIGRGLVAGIESKLREDSGVLVGLIERAGRELVRGLAAGIREELACNPAVSGEALGASIEKLAERSAAATVRGASQALSSQTRPLRVALKQEGTLRQASREIVGGMLEAIGAGLRRPLVTVAGAGSALVVLSLLSARWRRARS